MTELRISTGPDAVSAVAPGVAPVSVSWLELARRLFASTGRPESVEETWGVTLHARPGCHWTVTVGPVDGPASELRAFDCSAEAIAKLILGPIVEATDTCCCPGCGENMPELNKRATVIVCGRCYALSTKGTPVDLNTFTPDLRKRVLNGLFYASQQYSGQVNRDEMH